MLENIFTEPDKQMCDNQINWSTTVVDTYILKPFHLKFWKSICVKSPLNLSRLVSLKGSNMLKQTCTFELQICLSMYDLFVDTKR